MKHNSLFWRIPLCGLICGLAFFTTTTCVQAESESGISIVHRPETVRISQDGRIYVGDRETRLNQLARRLRREGYENTSTIYVSIPDETPRSVLVAVGRELASQGFRRVIFTKPPRATAETEGAPRH